MSTCSHCNGPFKEGQHLTNCIICNDFFHATTNCLGATATEVRCFEMRTMPVVTFRCRKCKDSKFPHTAHDQLNEIKNEIGSKFDVVNKNYGTLINKVDDIADSVKDLPQIRKDVQYFKSDQFSEGIISEAMQRIIKSKNLLIYDVPERDTQDDDYAFINNFFRNFQFSMASITCHRIGVTKRDKPRPLRVIFPDASFVETVFKNKNLLDKGSIIRKDRTKVERNLYKKALSQLKEKEKAGIENLGIKYANDIPTVYTKKTGADTFTSVSSFADASNSPLDNASKN